MSQVLLATHRIQLSYTVNGLPHTYHAYCKANLVGATYMLDAGNGGVATDWTTCIQRLWTVAKGIFSTTAGTPAPAAVLQARSGTIWNPLQFLAVTGTPTKVAAYSPASQLTIVLRDALFKKLRIVWLECAEGYTGHAGTGAAFSTAVDPLVNIYNGDDLTAGNPWYWQKSRGDRFIAASGADAGITLDLNDKLKRARGLE